MKFYIFNIIFLFLSNSYAENIRNLDQIFEHFEFPKTNFGSKELSKIHIGILDDEPGRAQKMAQAISQLLGKKQTELSMTVMQVGENDLVAYKEAVKEFIEKKVNVVVSNVVFHSYGNFKGDGFINKLVSEATRSGIFWIQASPFFYQRVFNLPLHFTSHPQFGEVMKVGQLQYASLVCRRDETTAKLILSWNSFAAGRHARGTDKDLDLYLVKEGNVVLKSERRQVLDNPNLEKEEVLFPCEEIKTELSQSSYEVYIKKVSGEFDSAVDRVRLTVKSSKKSYYNFDEKKTENTLTLIPSDAINSVSIPADNREVLAVSDITIDQTVDTTWDGRVKPDMGIDRTEILFSNGTTLDGVAGATALTTAFTLLLKVQYPNASFTPEKMIALSKVWFQPTHTFPKKMKDEFIKNGWWIVNSTHYHSDNQKLLNNNIVLYKKLPSNGWVFGVWDQPSQIAKESLIGYDSLSESIKADIDGNKEKLVFCTYAKKYLYIKLREDFNFRDNSCEMFVEFIKPKGYFGHWKFPIQQKLEEIFLEK